MNIVHLIDCMEFMKGIPDKYYELCIVDPPYGIGANKMQLGNGKRKIYRGKDDWDKEPPSEEYFKELFRVSKNQIIWGGNYFTTLLNNDSQCWIVWDKQKPEGVSFADVELAYTSFNLASRIFRFAWNGMIQGNMKNKEYKIHPTQKPVALYKWLLQNYAKPNDKIFDSHVGSGSIRIACHDMGISFEGCEIDKDYWQAQEERYQQHILQIDLFPPKELAKTETQQALF